MNVSPRVLVVRSFHGFMFEYFVRAIVMVMEPC